MPLTTIVCDKSISTVFPCLQCLNESELIALLVLMMSEESGYTLPQDTNKLLNDSACLTCLSDKQLLQSLVALAANDMLDQDTTANQLREKMKCLVCASRKQLYAAIVYLICKGQIFQADSNGDNQR